MDSMTTKQLSMPKNILKSKDPVKFLGTGTKGKPASFPTIELKKDNFQMNLILSYHLSHSAIMAILKVFYYTPLKDPHKTSSRKMVTLRS